MMQFSVAFVLVLMISGHKTFGNSSVIKTFRPPAGPAQNLLYVNLYQNGGAILVAGGRNALYMLSAKDLSTRAIYKTGPVMDSVLCPPYPIECDDDSNRTTTDTYNRVLLQLGTEPLLLACGTTSQGICSIHDLQHDLNVTTNMDRGLRDNYVASKRSTVAFFGTGINENVLFAASAYDGRPLGFHPYAVSARMLNYSGFFSLLSSNGRMTSFVNVVERLKPTLRIFYLYGFSHNGFAYFVTVRRQAKSRGITRTWLSRVCESDKSFRTYMEMPIQCSRERASLIATSATVGPRAVGTNATSEVLAVAFTSERRAPSLYAGSVVCFFDMASVENAFTNVVARCSIGKSSANLSPLYHENHDDLACKTDEHKGNISCTPGQNSYIESSVPLTGRAKLTLVRRLATSLTVMQQNGTTVVWVGDKQGFLHKILLLSDTTHHLVSLNFSKHGTTGIQRSTVIDDSGAYGYFLIGEEVMRIPVGSCRVYDRCSQCMRSRGDPLRCGWCGDHCAHFAECPHREKFTLGRCPIEVTHTHPVNGSLFGGTPLTIEGDNLGSPEHKPYSSIEIRVGGNVCDIVKWSSKRVLCTTPAGRDASKVDIVITVKDTLRGAVKRYDVIDTRTIKSGFEYKVAGFSSITPVYDPTSGITHVTITGSNFDIGSQQVVKIGKSVCGIERINATFLECSTNTVDGDQVAQGMQVFLTIDGAQVPFVAAVNPGSKPTFKAKPVVDDIEPKRSTYRGRFSFAVKGAHLDSVINPVIVTRVTSLDGKKHEEIKKGCQVTENGEHMLCPGTPLTEFSVIGGAELEENSFHIAAQIRFQMDELDLPLGQFGERRHFTLVYEPPPEFDLFPEGVQKVDPDEPSIEITGKRFQTLEGAVQLSVRMSGVDHACNVTTMTSRSIICKIRSDILASGSSQAFEVLYAGQSYPLGEVMQAAQEPSLDSDLVSAGVVAPVLFVLLGVGIFLLLRRYCRAKNASQSTCPSDFNDFRFKSGARYSNGNSYVQRSVPAAQEPAFQLDQETTAMLESENLLLKRERLHLGRVIGQGQFGCVYWGVLKASESDQGENVAVKTLRNNSRGGELDSRSFLEEALIMKDFHHVNVLQLIGLTIDDIDGLMVITPYMKHGDVLSYIRDENNNPTVHQLITFGIHVAEGMKYLSDAKFVHRDLAARNCMLSGDMVVRVADFGLSRDVYEKDYYSSDNKTKLPVRWMAPESLEKGVYSHKTDVWSYGVLLWELITRGVTPYPDVDNWDIINFLKQGRRMQQPDFCPKELYIVMLQCWQNDPKKRPSFETLVTDVTNIIAIIEKRTRDRRVSLNVTYVNCSPLDTSNGAETSPELHPLSEHSISY
ncbi:hepatocyte growth factor receptor-like isoform X2 [Amblyomma americanum]